ncbi:MAG: hypothetical protein ACPG4T_19310 [Nannocystaceae bacterium]
MATNEISVIRADAERLHIEVRGQLGLRLAGELRDVLLPRVAAADAGFELLIDLRGVSTYDLDGRSALAKTHASVVRQARRCVYLTDRPRIRGMVLFMTRRAGSDRTRPLPSMERAEQWFATAEVSWGEQAFDRTRSLMKRLMGRGKARGSST